MKLIATAVTACWLFASVVFAEDLNISLGHNKQLVMKDRGKILGSDIFLVEGETTTYIGTKSINLQNNYKIRNSEDGVTAIEWSGVNKMTIKVKTPSNREEIKVIEYDIQFDVGTKYTACYYLEKSLDAQWYGGPQQKKQYWPIQKGTFKNYPYLTKELDNAGVAERYWLTSLGYFIHFDLRAPLFMSQDEESLCLSTDVATPYRTDRSVYNFTLTEVYGPDLKTLHQYAVDKYLNKPTGIPDLRMIKHPIWSTWARYKRPINEEIVLRLANEINSYNFSNSQFEIDDLWEICYGSLTFDVKKFPDIKGLIKKLNNMGFRTTLWIHPFINKDCDPWYTEALSKGYLVKDAAGSTVTSWWNDNGTTSTYIDFTKPEASKWFSDRLVTLLNETGIDSYKFDAGESSWTPDNPILTGEIDLHPHLITQDYVREVAKFGPMIEVRSGQGTQDLPVFMRIIDKDSTWTWNNGLPTLVTTLLQLNMNGYTLVLPDMVGGNGYDELPTKELFIRWLQANVFMPGLQYSYVPWDFDNETVAISQKFTQLHAEYSDAIAAQCQRSVDLGEPVNPPIWWLDPTDRVAQKVYDEFLLGDLILAAPVMEENQVTRTIYLPRGQWLDPNNGNKVICGPTHLYNYSAPLDVLPYFINTDSVLYVGK